LGKNVGFGGPRRKEKKRVFCWNKVVKVDDIKLGEKPLKMEQVRDKVIAQLSGPFVWNPILKADIACYIASSSSTMATSFQINGPKRDRIRERKVDMSL
jgi:hypothetical protein